MQFLANKADSVDLWAKGAVHALWTTSMNLAGRSMNLVHRSWTCLTHGFCSEERWDEECKGGSSHLNECEMALRAPGLTWLHALQSFLQNRLGYCGTWEIMQGTCCRVFTAKRRALLQVRDRRVILEKDRNICSNIEQVSIPKILQREWEGSSTEL